MMSGSGREVVLDIREWPGGPHDVREWLGDPHDVRE